MGYLSRARNFVTLRVYTNLRLIIIPIKLQKRTNLHNGNRAVIIVDAGTFRLIPVVLEANLIIQSCSPEEMMRILRKSRTDELELENK